MSFPIISGTDARRWISASRGHSDDGEQPEVQTQELGSDEDWDEVAGQIKDALAPLKAEAGEINRSRGAGRRFEAPAAIALHKAMPSHHPAYSDSGFWMWLAVTHFSDLIEWRYGNKEGGSDLKNYGSAHPSRICCIGSGCVPRSPMTTACRKTPIIWSVSATWTFGAATYSAKVILIRANLPVRW
jgi:hypothetical protein